MGLSIYAYRGLQEAADQSPNETEDGDVLDEDVHVFYNNSSFPGRFEGLKEATNYTADESLYFRAGSYGGYGAWRNELAVMAGYASADAVYEQEEKTGTISGPFVELISFSDCEGAFGPVVSAKLAKDFADFQAQADVHADEYWRGRYASWREAFEMAADGGAVQLA